LAEVAVDGSQTSGLSVTAVTPDWFGGIEAFETAAKGRGIRATRNLAAGEPVLIQHAFAEGFSPAAKVAAVQYALGGRTSQRGSMVALKAALASRVTWSLCTVDSTIVRGFSHAEPSPPV
jgi:hypothetical protein